MQNLLNYCKLKRIQYLGHKLTFNKPTNMKKQLHLKLFAWLLLLTGTTLHAQWQNGLWTGKQTNNWYFGINAGLNFDTAPPTALTDGQTGLVTSYAWSDETGDIDFDNPFNGTTGSSCMSDSEGNLLFYTNGFTVWNKDHIIMSNGANLISSAHHEQSTIIVPGPGNTQKYYIFSVQQQSHSLVPNPSVIPVDPYPNPLVVYSEVDMSLDNGLGAVTANKNITITTESFYSDITATYHEDGNQIWVLFAPSGTNTQFKTYLLTEEGLNMTPVVSDFGFSATPGVILGTGQMKFSPDGTKVVKSVPSAVNQKVEVYEFNKETGEVGNLIVLLNQQDFVPNGEFLGARGLEFSPNSKFLYTAGQFSGILKQFNLEAGTAAEIKASGVVLSQPASPPQFNNFLQAGPDGKIYLTYARVWTGSGAQHNNLNVINNPNNEGVNSGFQTNAINLISGVSLKNLPNFLQDYFASGILHEGECEGTVTTFSTLRIPGITNIAWDFGDPASGDDNASTALEPSHVFSSGGTYTVTATITSNGAQQTATTEVIILPAPGAVAPGSEALSKCADGSGNAAFDLTGLDATILDGQSPTEFTVAYYASPEDAASGNAIAPANDFTTAGQLIYAVVTNTNTGCQASIQFEVIVLAQPALPGVSTFQGCSPFDLVSIAGAPEAGTTYSFHASEGEALDNTGAIATPEGYIVPGNAGSVFIRATGETGCVQVGELLLEPGNCIIPRGISPNGDGHNDSFDLSGFDVRMLSIYNRYGTRVYSKGNYTSQWSGQSDNGQELPTGTYFYVVEAQGGNSTGWVYINR